MNRFSIGTTRRHALPRRSRSARDERGELFDALADTLPEAALIHAQTILYANRAAGELFGVEPDTLIGKPITDLLRPASRAGCASTSVGRRGQRAVAAVRGPADQQRRPRGVGGAL